MPFLALNMGASAQVATQRALHTRLALPTAGTTRLPSKCVPSGPREQTWCRCCAQQCCPVVDRVDSLPTEKTGGEEPQSQLLVPGMVSQGHWEVAGIGPCPRGAADGAETWHWPGKVLRRG